MSGPRREIRAFRGYDRRDEGYGIGGVKFWLILRRGPLAISWELLTEMFPPTVQHSNRHGETAGALVSHSPHPIAGWDGPNKCELVPGGQCFSTKGYLVGDEVMAALIAGGSDGAFDRMGEILTSWLEDES